MYIHTFDGLVEALVLRVPNIFAAFKIGHDLTSVSTMHDYMDVRLSDHFWGCYLGWVCFLALGPARSRSLARMSACSGGVCGGFGAAHVGHG